MDTALQPMRLDGKVALVTGASSGLGQRFAEVLAQAGAAVALTGRRLERLSGLQQQISQAGGKAYACSMDVTDIPAIAAAVQAVESALGPIDILINNSGVNAQQRMGDYSEADYDFILDTNTKGAFFVAQEVGRRMIAGRRPGRIVNVASVAGVRVISQLGVYGMSKAALISMTKSMAHEWARHGISVNAICPGYIETEINSDYWKTDGGRKLMNMLPRRRIGRPQDLDGLLLLLASDAAGFINGAVITADDGFAAG
ncbi:MAG: SDR family oxidoreductase [Betaproteobacteria bacterium]|nr:SDR family oxidoreductase [Betaproteobacteria bacterium]